MISSHDYDFGLIAAQTKYMFFFKVHFIEYKLFFYIRLLRKGIDLVPPPPPPF